MQQTGYTSASSVRFAAAQVANSILLLDSVALAASCSRTAGRAGRSAVYARETLHTVACVSKGAAQRVIACGLLWSLTWYWLQDLMKM